MTDLKNKLEVFWIQKGSFGYVVVEGKDSNPEWVNRPFRVCSILVLNKIMHKYQKEIESLKLERNEFKKYSITWYGKKNELEQELQKTREQLSKAEKVINAYADIKNMNEKSFGFSTEWSVDSDDFEETGVNDSYKTVYFYGKRARQYFKDKQGEG